MKAWDRQRGLTVIELMVTMAIIAVIATIAIPAYRGYISSAKNTEGMNNLAALELAEHEFFLENNKFFTGGDTATLIAQSKSTWKPAEPASERNFAYSASDVGGGTIRLRAQGTREVDSSVVLTKDITN
jgi:type IV pilus assembly protein PilE